MGLFGGKKSKSINTTKNMEDAEKEVKPAVKQRLLETEGDNNGEQLSAGKGQSVRRIFG